MTTNISPDVQNVINYLRSFDMFKPVHKVEVAWVPNNHGYPYRASCTCGWKSNTYAAKHAAESMGDDHIKEV